jgi:hypothetical protein
VPIYVTYSNAVSSSIFRLLVPFCNWFGYATED